MNTIFRIVWNVSRGQSVVTSELAKRRSKSRNGLVCRALLTLGLAVGVGGYSPVQAYEAGGGDDCTGDAGRTAIGSGASACDTFALALGANAVSSEESATAIGRNSASSGHGAVAIGLETEAAGAGSFAGGEYAQALGNYSVALGGGNAAGSGANAGGAGAIALGTRSVASDLRSLALGAGAVASSESANAIGDSATASGISSIAIGTGASAESVNTGAGTMAGGVAVGGLSESYGGVALGFGAVAGSGGSGTQLAATALGMGTQATGNRSIGIGTTDAAPALATGGGSIAVGNNAEASANGTIAIGRNTTASVDEGIAVGSDTTASGDTSLAFGQGSTASAASTLAFGDSATASGISSIAMGTGATAEMDDAVAIGNAAIATGGKSVSIGSENVASGNGAVAIGDPNTATGDGAIAQGMDNTATGNGTVALGNTNMAGGGGQAVGTPGTAAQGAVSIGYQNIAEGQGAIALGSTSSALEDGAIALGDAAVASNADSVALGSGTTSSSNSAVAVGAGASATNAQSIAIGGESAFEAAASSGGNSAIAIGVGSNATGNTSIAMGFRAETLNQYGIALGADSSVSGDYGMAMGLQAEASGTHAGAVGAFSDASGDRASAYGYSATASADDSVALGDSTASQVGAVALGDGATADIADSVALGSNANTAAAVGTADTTIAGVTYDFAGDTPVGTVSVGTSGNERTLTNVAAGRVSAISTDAINGSQLFATNQAIEDNRVHFYSVDGGTLDGNYDNDGATAANAMASGVNASAVRINATAVGHDSLAAGNNSVAMGNAATAMGANSVAIGNNATVGLTSGPNSQFPDQGVAIGSGATVGGAVVGGVQIHSEGVAIGFDASAVNTSQASPTAIGAHANADGAGAQIAIGDYATANGENSVAIGGLPFSTGTRAMGDYALAIGPATQAFGDNSVSLGRESSAAGDGAIAIGGNAASGANASQQDTIAIGAETVANTQGGIAIGQGARASHANSTALGVDAITAGFNATPSGTINGTNYTFAGGAPIGVVSVGRSGSERQITNVAAGRVSAISTDAINGSQLFATNQALEDLSLSGGGTNYYSVNSTVTGAGSNFDNDGATGANALAAGVKASAIGESAVAVGNTATAGTTRDIAIGNAAETGVIAGATGSQADNVAIGTKAQAFGGAAIAIGEGATATGTNTANVNSVIAIGRQAKANDTAALALGSSASTGEGASYATAIGPLATVGDNASNSVAIGTSATVADKATASTAVGQGATVNASTSVAVGQGATVATGAFYSTAVGRQATVNSNSSVAIGQETNVAINAAHGTAIGSAAKVLEGAVSGMAFGTNAQVMAKGDIAMGRDASVDGTSDGGPSIGLGADVAINGSADATAIGLKATIGTGVSDSSGATAIGSGTVVGDQSRNATAIGRLSSIGDSAWDSVALGSAATVGDNAAGSVSIGVGATNATGAFNSVALGIGTSNDASHSIAIGSYSTTSASDAIAIGSDTEAARNAIALGHDAKATGNQSISIGTGNQVSGDGSGAIGDPSIITGAGSYSLGNDNTIDADEAGTFGNDNILAATATGSRIIGNGNDIDVADAFVIGNGADVTVGEGVALGNGSIADTGAGVAGYNPTTSAADGLDAGIVATQSTTGAVAVGDAGNGIYRQITGVAAGTADSDAVNVAQLKASETHYYSVNDNGVIGGNYANDGATGVNALAAGVNTVASGTSSVAVGDTATAYNAGSIAMGLDAVAGVDGSATIANDIAQGANATATGGNTVAIGQNATATGVDGVSLGSNSTASGGTSTALGYATQATNTDTTAVGNGAQATGVQDTALGVTALASGGNSTAVGNQATSAGGNATAVGATANASGGQSSAFGLGATASDTNTTALGVGTQATSFASTAVGNQSKATGVGSLALGNIAQATETNTIAIGTGALASADDAVAIGTSAQASGERSIAIGDDAIATGSVAMGASSRAGNGGAAFGDGAVATYNGGVNDPAIVAGAALGENTSADVSGATALGTDATVTHEGSVALGQGSIADGSTLGTVAYQPLDVSGNPATVAAPTADSAVSVGSAGSERRITNVAAGAEDTDAVNVSQLKAVNDVASTGWNLSAQDAAAQNIAPGDEVNLRNSDGNLVVSQATDNGREEVTFNLDDDVVVNNSVSVGSVVADATTNDITGLSNTNLTDPSFATVGRAATEEQLAISAAASRTEVAAGTNVTSVGQTTGADGQDIYTVNADSASVSAGSGAVDVTAAAPDANNVTDYAVDLSPASKDSLTLADSALQTVVTQIDGNEVKTLDQNDNVANFVTGDNIVLSDDNGAIEIATAQDVTFTTINSDSLAITGGPTLTGGGIDMNTTPISNLADGVNAQDAVNLSQLENAAAASKTEVIAGTNVTSVGQTTGADGQDIYTVNADGASVSAGSGAVDVTAAAPDANNVTDYAVDLSKASKDSLTLADSALQTVVTQVDGTDVKTLDQNDNVANFISGDNIELSDDNGAIEIATSPDLTADSLTINNGPTLNDNGIDMGGDTITNLGDPVNGGDAVNLDYFDANRAHYYSVNDGGTIGGNYNNDGATGLNAIASGVDASSSGDGAVALGFGASAPINDSLALGSGSVVDRALAPDTGFIPAGSATIEFNTTDKELLGAISVGDSDSYRQITNVADGTEAQDAVTVRQLQGAVGSVIDSGTKYFRANSTAPDAAAVGNDSIAVGPTTVTNGDNGIGMGNGAIVGQMAPGGTAIGNNAEVMLSDGIAFGTNALSEAQQGIALGAGATVSHDQSVALGSNSSTDDAVATSGVTIAGDSYTFAGSTPDSTVSIGSVGNERTLTNVAAGRVSETSTDAINGSQLFASNQAIEEVSTIANTGWDIQTNNDAATNVAPGDTVQMIDGKNIAITRNGTDITVATIDSPQFGNVTVNTAGGDTINGLSNLTFDPDNFTSGQAASEDQLKAVSDVANTGWNLSAQDAAAQNIAPNDEVNLRSSDGNLVITQATDNGREEVTFNLNDDVVVNNSVSVGNVVTDATTNDITGLSNTDLTDPSFATLGRAATEEQLAVSAAASRTEVTAGTNVASVGQTTGAAGQDIYTVNANGASVSAGSGAVDVTAAAPDANNVTDYAVDLSQASKDSLTLADSALQTVVTQIDGTNVKTLDQNDNVANFISGDNIELSDDNGAIEIATSPDLTADSLTINNGPTLNDNGIDMGGDTITNLGDPVNGGDAVNLDYFDANRAHYYSVNDGGIIGGNYNNDGATGLNAIASGVNATASGEGAVALGFGATAPISGSLALGSGSVVDRALAPDSGFIPAGSATIEFNTTDKELLGAISVGDSDSYRQITNVADGTQAQDAVTVRQLQGAVGSVIDSGTKYFRANSTEPDSLAVGNDSIAVGPTTVTNGDNGIGMGNGAIVGQMAPGGTAIGNNAEVMLSDGIAFGTNALSEAQQGIALGAGATVSHDQSVALGSNSSTEDAIATSGVTIAGDSYTFAGTTPDSTVSIGSAGNERTLTNVAAGRVSETSTDAINGSQLFASNQAIEEVSTIANTGWDIQTNNDAATNVAPGDTVQMIDGKNIAITRNGTDITVATADSVAFDNVAITGGPTLSGGGIDMNNTPISNLADGVNAQDAVNLSQLQSSAAASRTEVFAGTNVASVDQATGADGQDIYTVNADGASVSAGSGAVDVTAAAPDANNVTDYAVDLSQASKDSLTLADSALQTVVTQIDGNEVKTLDQNDNVANFISGDNIELSDDNGAIEIATSPDLTADSLTINNGPTLNDNGIDMGGDTITNLGDPVNGGDAVNLDYFDENRARYYSINDGGTIGGNYNNDGATGLNAIASGVDASASGDGAAALGFGANAPINDSLALGSGSVVDRALAPDSGFIPAGSATIEFNTTDKELLGAISVGDSDSYRQITNVADGTEAQDAVTVRQLQGSIGSVIDSGTKYFRANSTEPDSTAAGEDSIAVGPTTVTNGDNGIGMGNGAIVGQMAPGGTAIGNNAEVMLSDGIAFGTNALSEAQQGIALGAGSRVSHDQSVALGSNSVTEDTVATSGVTIAGDSYTFAGSTPDSTVSIGSVGNERTLTNVAAGRVSETSTDAINGSQLFASNQAIEEVKATANAGWNLSTENGVASNVAPNGEVNLRNTDGNIMISQTSNNGREEVTFDLGDDVAIGNSLTVGQDGPVISGEGITNLSEGDISVESKDAINGSQLYATNQWIEALENSVTNVVGDGSDDYTTNNGLGIRYVRTNDSGLAVSDAFAQGEGSTAVGYEAVASAGRALAMGYDAIASHQGSVALGEGARTAEAVGTASVDIAGQTYQFAGASPVATVSVGSVGNERTITNVAAGRITADSTDAINGSQLYAAMDFMGSLDDRLTIVEGDTGGGGTEGVVKYDRDDNGDINYDSVTLEGEDGTKLTNVADGDISDDSSDAINGSQLHDTNQNVADNTTNITDNSQRITNNEGNIADNSQRITTNENSITDINETLGLGLNFGADEGDTVNRQLGDTVAITGDDNITTKTTDDGVQVTMNRDLDVDSVTTGNTTVNNEGVSIKDGPSMTINGIDAGGTTITNVAPGVNESDAVNVGQMNELGRRFQNEIVNVHGRIDSVERNANAGSASAIAASTVPQAWMPGKSMVGVGAGTYGGESAVSVGISRLSDNGRWVIQGKVTGDSQSNFGAGIGAGWHW